MLLSFGLFTSALSANQIVAAILGIALSLTFWLAGGLATTFDGPFGRFLEYISVQSHIRDFVLGLITSTNVIYFLSITAIALFLTIRVLEIKRWR
jgi:ABC-2 type transport system permease protein